MKANLACLFVLVCSVSSSPAPPPNLLVSTNYSVLAFQEVTRAPATGKEPVAWGQEIEHWRVGISAPKPNIKLGEPVFIHAHIHNTDSSKPNYRSGPAITLHQCQFIVIDSHKHILLSTNEFLVYRRTHGDYRDDDPILNRSALKGSGLPIGPNEIVTLHADLGRIFDLSQPGEYLVYMTCPKAYGIAGKEPPFFELKTGNVLLNIIAADAERPDPPVKHDGNASPTNAAPTKTKASSGQPTTTGATSTGNHAKSATPGAKGGSAAGGNSDATAIQKGGVEGAFPGSTGSALRESTFSRHTGLALLFAVLGFGVLWWMFRGK